MQLSVSGKQIDVGDALRSHVEDSLGAAVGKYFANPVDTQVVFSRDGARFRVDISVHVGRGITVQSRGGADDPYVAFDDAAEHMSTRLRRHKRRLRDHHRERHEEQEAFEAASYVLQGEGAEEEAGDEPVVIAEMTTSIPTLTVGEAVMRLDLSEDMQLMFRNRAHGGLNLVHRRPDGNIGWIDPRGNRETR